MLGLPIRDGGFGFIEPSKSAEFQYTNSLIIIAPLVSILTGGSSATVLDARDQISKAKVVVRHSNWEQISECFDNIYQQFSAALKKCVVIVRKRVVSSWLSALPI